MLWDCSRRLTNKLDMVSADGCRVFWHKLGNILMVVVKTKIPPTSRSEWHSEDQKISYQRLAASKAWAGASRVSILATSILTALFRAGPETGTGQSVQGLNSTGQLCARVRADKQTWMLTICMARNTSPGLPVARECSSIIQASSSVLCLVIIHKNIALSYMAIILYSPVIWVSWIGSFRTRWTENRFVVH